LRPPDDPTGRWPLPGAEDLRDRLLAAYSLPTRRYHDLRHLDEVLDRLAELGEDRPAVLLAAWFHDAVYEGERDDEERSASLAEAELGGRASADVVAEVARLVRMTASHRPAAGDVAGEHLSDADLAILAAPPARYEEYVVAVREEYAHLSDGDFAAGRAAVLRDLLAKPSLFHSPRARALWEDAARANVTAELARL
jgi:predicted metal-dependent HD superfamily phosphohydrolase